MINDLFIIANDSILINVYLTPGAHSSCINGTIQTIDNKIYIKISVNNKPVENKANLELISIISEYFDIPKNNIEIKRGSRSRYKQIILHNYGLNDIPNGTKKLLIGDHNK